MNKQRGVALSALIIWGVVITLVVITGMRVVPSAIEYKTILSATKAVASEAKADSTVTDIRKAYARYVEVDNIESVAPADLDITKDSGQVVISFVYEKRIHLFANISVVIEYSGSSQ